MRVFEYVRACVEESMRTCVSACLQREEKNVVWENIFIISLSLSLYIYIYIYIYI